jgi:hypothetical protein
MAVNLLTMPALHVGQGMHVRGPSMSPCLDQRAHRVGSGRRIRTRHGFPFGYHEIRGLGWDDQLLHATVFNRRHPLMEVV